MNNTVISIKDGNDFVVLNDECAIVNGIIAWRQSMGDVIQDGDFLDFCVPRTVEELADMALAVNTTFMRMGSAMRIDNRQGVIIPTVA